MIYILIAVILGSTSPSSTVAEFNTRDACEAASKEYNRQVVGYNPYYRPVIFCAAKGEKK